MTSRRIGDAVLGCLLLEPELCEKLDDFQVSERHFYHLAHQLVFRSVRSLWETREVVDLVTVENDMMRRGTLVDAGGAEALTRLFDAVPTTANFPSYVNKLFREHEEWTRKLNVQTALKLLDEGNETAADYLLQQAVDIGRLRLPGPKTLPVETFAEMHHDLTIPPLVEEFLDTETVNVLYGPSNSGKSFVALDLAFSIATGRPWANRRVLQGGVVYVAAEAPGSIRRRVMALRTVYPGIDHARVPLFMVPVPVDLVSSEDGITDLIATVQKIQADNPVRLVIVDTLACTMAGGDENSFETMGALAGRLGRLRFECKTAVLGVHHSGKDADRGARGHSSLRAAVDTELEIRIDDGVRSVSITKSRDGVLGTRVGFALEPVSIGRDSLGTEVRVPTVTYTGDAEVKMPTGRPLEVFQAAIAALEVTGGRFLSYGTWLDSFKADDEACRGLSAGSIKRAFTRAVNVLVPGLFTRSENGYYLTNSGVTLGTRIVVPNPPLGTSVLSPTFFPTRHARGQAGDEISPLGTPWGQPGDSAQVSPREMAGDNVSPPYRGETCPQPATPTPGLDLEEEEARARVESLRPKNQ